LEDQVAADLAAQSIPFQYEEHKLPFVQPAKHRTYKPDFIIPNGIIIETKGRFVTADRQKHLWIKDQHPGLDIRFVFSNPRNKIGKGSKTTYGMWCEKHGFLYATKSIPRDWLNEPPLPERIQATIRALGWTPPTISKRRTKT